MKKLVERYELKYLMSQRQAGRVEDYLNKICLKKDKVQKGEYHVTSLYFDTPTLEDYHDKNGGYLQRQKLRARVYCENFNNGNEQGGVRFEIKKKNNMRVYKTKFILSDEEFLEFLKKGPVDFYYRHKKRINEENLEDLEYFFDLFIKKCYKPHIVVSYKRKAYICNFVSNLRLTIDSDIKAFKWRRNNRFLLAVPVFKKMAVLEIKFSKVMPWWFKDMVYRFNLSHQSFSKYNHSVDAINRFNPFFK